MQKRYREKRPAHPNPPNKCDACRRKILDVFYDMRTRSGPWANLCAPCALDGVGIGKCGEGQGQKYIKFEDQFVKVEG